MGVLGGGGGMGDRSVDLGSGELPEELPPFVLLALALFLYFEWRGVRCTYHRFGTHGEDVPQYSPYRRQSPNETREESWVHPNPRIWERTAVSLVLVLP